MNVAQALSERISAMRLIDHHVHAPSRRDVELAGFELLATESNQPAPEGTSHLFSQVGFAIRALAAPLLGLPPSAPIADYWSARARLAPGDSARLFLAAAGVDQWLLDTGHLGDELFTPSEVAGLGVGTVSEIVRLESVLESVALSGSAADLHERFIAEFDRRTAGAVGVKSIVAYRFGFDFDPARPSRADIAVAADRWLGRSERSGRVRVDDPVLLRMLLWTAVDRGLPLQLHAGYGDADIRLHRCDPALLTDWITAVSGSGTDIVLLHCYPYHRAAGYLAQIYPSVYFDVGLAINFVGAAASRIVAESLELAPFHKILYSSDAWGLPELHFLGSALWRRAMATVLGGFVESGLWTFADAVDVAQAIGRANAVRLYGLGG